ncbi:MAG: transglutaminase-like domain-containing protein [Phycisphaeraceae bacterium]
MLTARTIRLMTLVALSFGLMTLSSRAEPIDLSGVDPRDYVRDDWYLDRVDGKAAGYWRSRMAVEGDRIVTSYEEVRHETHGGEPSTYTTRTVWTETTDFEPIRVVIETQAGSDKVTKTYRFLPDGIELTSEQNGRSIRRVLDPIDAADAAGAAYFTPAQETIATDLYLQRGVERFTFKTLDFNVGHQPFDTTYRRDKVETFVTADGREVDATRWVRSFSAFPGFEVAHWFADDRQLVGVAYRIEQVDIRSRLADATVADREFDPPELAHLSVVVPDRKIDRVHRQKRIVYELGYNAGESPIVPMTTAKQRVVRLGPGRARVTVDLAAEPDEAVRDDRPTDAHLDSSIMVDHEDAVVRALANKAIERLGEEPTTREIAEACKRQVARHLVGDSLSVGDGSASEAARSRSGDCTEASVLLAALLRVHGIQSRCVSGLVYSEQAFVGQSHVFVFHMWTQAWIEDADGRGAWVDLDAAMWRYGAGHIALGASSMGDESRDELTRTIPMTQGLTIRVIETD